MATDPVTFQWEGGRMEGEFSDQSTFTGLVETPDGFQSDLAVVTKETVYELDDQGKRKLPGRDYSGVIVFRFDIAERKSTGRLVGYWRVDSTTVKENAFAGVVMGVQMDMHDNELVWREQPVLYWDRPGPLGRYRPAAMAGFGRLFLVEGKLRLEFDVIGYDVDADTLKRTPSKDKFPKLVSRQVDRKQP
jgi:hypothetical protein